MDLTPEAADMLARLADGGMRDGLSLLDQCSAAEHIDAQAVLSSMGLAGSQKTAELLDAVCARSCENALDIFNTLWQAGKDPAGILDELGSLLRDVLLTQTAPKSCASLVSGAWPIKTLEHFAKNLSAAELLADLTAIENAPTGASSPRRSAEMCLISLCSPDCGEGLAALRARVARLERAVANGVPAAAPIAAEKPADAPKAPPAKPAAKPAPKPAAKPEPIDDRPPWEDDDLDRPPLPDDDYDRPPVPDDDYFAPPEDIPPAPQPVRESAPTAAPQRTPTAAPVADDALWDRLLPQLEGRLETYIYALLLPGSQTTGSLSGSTLTIHVTNPFAQMTFERPDVKSIIQQQASALCGREVMVVVTDSAAPARVPNEEKLAGLNRFANFKME